MPHRRQQFVLMLFLWVGIFSWVSSGTSAVAADAPPATAPSDRDNLAAEVKSDQDAVKSIGDELEQDNKDAADAEALAATPPADVKADHKTAYIDSKKNQAQTAHDAAKDAQERLNEAQKSLDDATARLKIIDHK